MATELNFKFYFILINNFKILNSIASKFDKYIRGNLSMWAYFLKYSHGMVSKYKSNMSNEYLSSYIETILFSIQEGLELKILLPLSLIPES